MFILFKKGLDKINLTKFKRAEKKKKEHKAGKIQEQQCSERGQHGAKAR